MSEKTKDIILGITLFLTLITLVFVIVGYFADREDNQQSSEQIQNLTEYVKQTIPDKPLIKFDFLTYNDSDELFDLKKQILYECENVGKNIFGDIKPKQELDLFVINKGKSTKSLVINIYCDVTPTESCKYLDSDIKNNGDIAFSNIQYEIKEINAQKEYKIILFFEDKLPSSCELSYSSEDIVEEKTEIKILENGE